MTSIDAEVTQALGQAISSLAAYDEGHAIIDFFRTVVSFDTCSVIKYRQNDGLQVLFHNISREGRRTVFDLYLTEAYLLDPIYIAAQKQNEDTLIMLYDILPDAFRRSAYFKDYYRALNVADEIAILVKKDHNEFILVSFIRSLPKTKFPLHEIKRMRVLLPIVAALCRGFDTANSGAMKETQKFKPRLRDVLEKDSFSALTHRERDVVAMMLAGHSSKAIARALDISDGTVRNHKKNIYVKLSIQSQGALFALFLDIFENIQV